MKIPDGGKPIKIGDPSFIYKGVYHPITWMGDKPYRPRVEMLVIKDAHFVYLRLKDGIDKVPPDKRTHSYSIPGGSIDSDSSKLEQAIAETNEEALVQVCLVYHSGVQYYEMYEPGFLLKGGDMPIGYVGSMSDVYVGVYDGPYDKSKVEEKDMDDDMANKGKFYRISDVAKYLRKEHIQALLSSQFVATDEKINLQLYRMDNITESTEGESPIVVPNEENLIYHGSTYDIETFQPMSLDLGNVYDGPGWSTFCFATYEEAKLFGAARMLTKLLEETYSGDGDTDELQVIYANGHLIISTACLDYIQEHGLMDMNGTFYVYIIDASNLSLGIGNDPALREYTFRESGITPKQKDRFDLSFDAMKESIEVISGKIEEYNYPVVSEYNKLLTHNYQKEIEVKSALQSAIKDGRLKPGDDIEKFMTDNSLEFNSDDIPLPELSIDPDEVVFEAVRITDSIMEETYPVECYGLPDRKVYPMPDAKHVKSAIRFFNYAKPEEEKELANNINKNIRKFNLTDIEVGEKNRFKKYYKPITETLSIKDFLVDMEEVAKVITAPEDSVPKKIRYMTYSKGKVLVQSLIDHISNGTITGIDDSIDIGHLVNSAYATLAEINMNQMELSAAMETKTIRRLPLYPIMEADDDEEPETATDYTAMADDAENGDGDVGIEDEPESATDYTAMADEQEESTDDETESDETSEDENTEDDTTDEETDETGDEATDYTEMADDAEGGEDTETDTSDDMDASESEENNNNSNAYNNKEVKNYFLLNSFLSLHQTVNDVLDTVNGVILPTPEANSIMAKVVKNLQDVKSFTEKFIQFQFSDVDYAFNLYYYNILVSALRMNLELFETTASMGTARKNKEKEE